MRYLLLSVLAVFFLVSFIPYALSERSPSYGVGIIIDKTFYETGDTIFISVTGFLLENLAQDATIKLFITAPNGDRVWSEEYKIPDSGILHTSVVTGSDSETGNYIVFARYSLNEGSEGCWNSQGNKISKANCEATATFTLKTTAGTPESVAETGADLSSLTDYGLGSKLPITYTLPPGVKSPAPNFENNFKGDDYQGIPFTYFDGEDGLTIGELYSYWDRGLYEEQDGDFIKIVSGDGKDLLVWYATLDCSHCNLADEVHPQDFKMYDGKDRVFTPIHSSIWGGLQGVVENPNFSWSEACSPWPVTVQPGVIDKIELCFEIPKNSDHFKFTGYAYGETQVWALFDKSTIGKTDSERSKELQELYDAVEESQSGGGCLIATAAFGSEMAPQVQMLREIRDNTVLQTESGSAFMTGFNQFYYSFSPAIADYERENPAFKEAVKITLTPLLASLTLLQYADIDSESEMLGYGIGVILLNIGMYFVAPAVLIMAVRKRI